MDNKIITIESVKELIYEVRGMKVMLDSDLAKIYGYSTKAFNQQVKNNLDKFPERYRFQLDKNDLNNLVRSKKLTPRNIQNNNLWIEGNEGGRTYLPYVFTEQGIYMLMTVLKGELATKQSIALIDTFKQMKDYLIENRNSISPFDSNFIYEKFNTYEKRLDKMDNDLKRVMDNFIDPKTYKHFLILNGQKIEASIAYQFIYKLSKHSLFIVDDYIDIKTLQLLSVVSPKVKIIIFTDNKSKNSLNKNYIDDFKKEYGLSISFKRNNNEFHDRYIFIDYGYNSEIIYHCGPSSKDAGNGICTITQVSDKALYRDIVERILKHEELEL